MITLTIPSSEESGYCQPSALMWGGFACPTAYSLQPRNPFRGAGVTSASRLSLTRVDSTGIFNPFPIGWPRPAGVTLGAD